MPSSHYAQISLVMEIIIRLQPRSVLDVGAGWGKYGALCREYLGRDVRIDALEGFAPYIGELHRVVYDEVLVGDARELLPRLRERYDLVLMADVFEHMPRSDGAALLRECERLAGATLISVPASWYPQEPFQGNDLEVHRAHYRSGDLAAMGFQVWRVANQLIALRSPRRLALRRTLLSWAAASVSPLWLTEWRVALRRRLAGAVRHPPPAG
jgi:hypothetical protein